MSTDTGEFKKCQECGASIYPEHLKVHTADFWGGKLLCSYCLAEKKNAQEASANEELVRLPDSSGPPPAAAPAAAAGVAQRSTKSSGLSFDRPVETRVNFRRSLTGGAQATRCRLFHCKLTDAAFLHLESQINDWADAHEDVTIKFATSSVGVIEGKHADPHLIVTVFY